MLLKKNYIDKKWVDPKMLKNLMTKNVLYNISKDQNSKNG
jgi:hypothetical protein